MWFLHLFTIVYPRSLLTLYNLSSHIYRYPITCRFQQGIWVFIIDCFVAKRYAVYQIPYASYKWASNSNSCNLILNKVSLNIMYSVIAVNDWKKNSLIDIHWVSENAEYWKRVYWLYLWLIDCSLTVIKCKNTCQNMGGSQAIAIFWHISLHLITVKL